MAYNHGREDRKWRIWKEAEEKLLRECGVDEVTIEQIRIADRADFNSNRRFYRWTNDVAEYLEDMADRERQAEVNTVAELLDEIESENLYQVLVTVDGRTLKIVLLKMQGYSTKEIAELMTEKRTLEKELEKYKTCGASTSHKSKLNEVCHITELIENQPLQFDDNLIRQMLECVVVLSKEQIKIVFKDGTEIDQSLT